MSEQRNKGRLPEEVDVIRARVDGVESMLQRALYGMATCLMLIAILALLVMKGLLK